MGIRYCPKCGSRAEDGDVFCIYCGAKLASGGAAPSTARPSDTASKSTGTAKPAGAAKKSSSSTIIGLLIVAVIVLGVGWYMYGRSDIKGTWRGYLEGEETVMTFWDDGTASVTMGGSDAASMEYEYENGYLQFRGLYGGGYDASDPVPCKIKGKTMIWSDPYTGEEVTFKKD